LLQMANEHLTQMKTVQIGAGFSVICIVAIAYTSSNVVKP